MSWLTDIEPGDGAPVLVVDPVAKDLGGFRVRRALPSVGRRMVGPFIFLDHMGPAVFAPGAGLDVRPHPHIGLATLTYLTEGSILHRDSLGFRQDIVPGDVNWMTAGRGIAHSERSGPARAAERRMAGIQSWVALPRAMEETDPGFFHHDAAALPALADTGVSVRVIAGEAYGAVSPVRALSPTLYVDATLDAGAALPLPVEHAERAVYVLAGAVSVGGEVYGAHRLLVFRPGDAITLRAEGAGADGPSAGARVLLLGGEPMDGPRHIWWNFVSSRAERIEAAKADWASGRFDVVPGESEFIPLPG